MKVMERVGEPSATRTFPSARTPPNRRGLQRAGAHGAPVPERGCLVQEDARHRRGREPAAGEGDARGSCGSTPGLARAPRRVAQPARTSGGKRAPPSSRSAPLARLDPECGGSRTRPTTAASRRRCWDAEPRRLQHVRADRGHRGPLGPRARAHLYAYAATTRPCSRARRRAEPVAALPSGPGARPPTERPGVCGRPRPPARGSFQGGGRFGQGRRGEVHRPPRTLPWPWRA